MKKNGKMNPRFLKAVDRAKRAQIMGILEDESSIEPVIVLVRGRQALRATVLKEFMELLKKQFDQLQ